MDRHPTTTGEGNVTPAKPDPTAEPQHRDDNRGFDPKKRFQYFLIRVTLGVLGRTFAWMPEKWAYGIGIKISMFAYRKAPKFRKLAHRHLTIAFGNEKSPEEIGQLLLDTYVAYGRNLAEYLMLPHKSNAWVESKVVFHDPLWHTRTALEQGKGVVSLGAHFGSWELVGARLGIYHYPLALIVKAQRDAIFTKLIMETRTKWGNEYIFKTRGIKEECFRQLKLNKLLGLLADQNASRNGVFVDFFGVKASTVRGPAEIARNAGTVILPSFPARNPDGTITLHVLEPIVPARTDDEEADIFETTQRCAKAIEDFARAHPTEYFWWHKRWATRPPGEPESENPNKIELPPAPGVK
jgi:KDO2-lipid IV(A) lauroyltransferase